MLILIHTNEKLQLSGLQHQQVFKNDDKGKKMQADLPASVPVREEGTGLDDGQLRYIFVILLY